MRTHDVVPVTDLAAAGWLVDSLRGGQGRVRDVVPAVYETYIRVPNDEDSLWRLRDVLAEHTPTSGPCWYAIWEGWPLPKKWQAAPKFRLPDRDLLLFAGTFDDLEVIAIEFACAVMELGGSGFALHVPGRRPTQADRRAAAAQSREERHHESPSLWWPEDRSWVVGSEVDSDATYVAASRPIADDLLAAGPLAATKVEPDAPITIEY